MPSSDFEKDLGSGGWLSTEHKFQSHSSAKKLTAIHEYMNRSTEEKGGGPGASHCYGCFKNRVLSFVVYNARKRHEGGRSAGKPSWAWNA